MKNFGMKTKVNLSNLKEVEEKVTEALKKQGFGVLTEIDVASTFKKKLDVDFRPYKILGACNPNLAHQALNIDDRIGLLLPCNVVLQQKDDYVEVSIIDPMQMAAILPDEGIRTLMEEATGKLSEALDEIGSAGE